MAMREGDAHLVDQRMEVSKQLGRDLYQALQVGPLSEGKALTEVDVNYSDLLGGKKYDPFRKLLSQLDTPYRKLILGVTFENKPREIDDGKKPAPALNYRFTLFIFHKDASAGHFEISFGDHGRITLPHNSAEKLPKLSNYVAAIEPNLDRAPDKKTVPPTEEELMLYENFKDLLLAKVAGNTEA